MTHEKLDVANKLMKEAGIYNEERSNVEKLLERSREITQPTNKYIDIQLGEGWAYTPVAKVRVDIFKQFLKEEMAYFDSKIAEREQKLEEL